MAPARRPRIETHGMGITGSGTRENGRPSDKEITWSTRSEVVGNTAQGRNNTMYNAEVHHRAVNEAGSFKAESNGGTATVFQNFYLSEGLQGRSPQGNQPGSSHIQSTRHDITMLDIEASLPERFLPPSNVNRRNAELSPPGQAVIALRQRCEALKDNTEKLVAEIREIHLVIDKKFRLVGHQTPGFEDFYTYQGLFEITVQGARLISRIEETLRTWTPIATPIGFPEVENVRNRLEEILDNLKSAQACFGNVNSIRGRVVDSSLRRPRQKSHAGSSLNQPQRSGIQKSNQKSNPRGSFQESPLPVKGAGSLKNKMQLLCVFVGALQHVVIHKLSPPSGDLNETQEHSSAAKLPPEFEVARVAAAMLYKSLGNLCPNPNHDSHDVLFKLDTEETFVVADDGTKSGTFDLRVAFEGSVDCQTWFDVHSSLKVQEVALDPKPEGMDVDVTVSSGGADDGNSFDSSIGYRRHHQDRSRDRSFVSSFRSEHCAGEHTARFCLRNYRQQKIPTRQLAAELRNSDACTHAFFYPGVEDSHEVPRDDAKAPKLRDIVRKRLKPRERIRLARIIAESLLKFNSSDWLCCDLNGDNVLVYTIRENLEPHLRIQLCSSKASTPGYGQELSRVLPKLAAILADIALGSKKRPRLGNDPDEVYEEVKQEMNIGYAEVIRHCQRMAEPRESGTADEESFVDLFYEKVVSALRTLEARFETPS